MASGTYKTEALVLRKRALGEADVLVGLLSCDQGRLDGAARGARRAGGGLAGRLEPFSQVRLMLAHGRSLDAVTQVEVVDAHRRVTSDLDRLAVGTYFLDLYATLVDPGPHGGAARVYASLLRALQEIEEETDVGRDALGRLCRRAELRLCAVLGLAPGVTACVRCGGTEALCWFSAAEGGLLCAACGQVGTSWAVSREATWVLRGLQVPGRENMQAACALASLGALREVERLLRAHMEWHWPNRLRSRGFLEQVQEQAARAEPGVGGGRRSEGDEPEGEETS